MMKKTSDIILLSYESPDLLKLCVESVLEHTKVSSRLLIVDNASKNSGVREYLLSIKGNDTVSVETIFNETNMGFGPGTNKGMKLSNAPFVCLLNNDCIVTDGWLEEMIAIASSDEHIGLVNPQSSTFGSSPDEDGSIDEHVKHISNKKGKYVELGNAIGFACLVKREVIEKIGYLDEIYKMVCYEDTDYSVRARKAGFIPVMAEGSYVFHLECASQKNLAKKKEIHEINKKIFENKWGKQLRLLLVVFPKSKKCKNISYDILRKLAGQRAFVNVWTEASCMDQFDRRGVIRHADICFKAISNTLLNTVSLWKTLTKKKKFDAVIMPRSWAYYVLCFFSRLRGTVLLELIEDNNVRLPNGKVFDLKISELLAEYLRSR